MALVGYLSLLVAFAMTLLGAAALIAAAVVRPGRAEAASNIGWVGRMCAIVSFIALTLCCAVLVWCFMSGDNTIEYVVENRSNSASGLAWLYRLSGLWAGRQGSLLFWAWIISCFGFYLALRYRDAETRLDDAALGIALAVLAAFAGVLFCSSSNMPFKTLDASWYDSNGNLVSGSMLGMNTLLEHWAMAIHPPTLFIGYAGLTVPFAYALASFALGDDSKTWVLRVNGIASFSWLFLGLGIGLGSVWAYVVLGWGGYWGWDPVENASLLSWLATTALMHSLTLYRTRGVFKRWSVVAACFAFMFVIVGTFISRSGLVQSVHAFAGDTVSLVLFAALIVVAFAAGVFGIVGRRKSFAVQEGAEQDSGSFFSLEMGYFLNNAILMVGAFVLAYLTIASALPAFFPLGGQSIGTGTYNAIARPLGIVLLLVMALGPLLGWKRTERRAFWKKARVPGACALVLFAVLVVYFATTLLPAYEANLSAGDSSAAELAAMGPAWYYNGLAVVGFAVASLLVFNSLFMLGRLLRSSKGGKANPSGSATLAELGKQAGAGKPASGVRPALRGRLSTAGGMLAHAGMGVILIGLIGSSMYVTEHSGYLGSTGESSQAADVFQVKDYELSPLGSRGEEYGTDILYTLELAVRKDGRDIGTLAPTVEYNPMTQQQKLNAAVISEPLQDFFVVYRGVNDDEDYSIDARVNPLISFVWAGFAVLMAGTALGVFAVRGAKGARRASNPGPSGRAQGRA